MREVLEALTKMKIPRLEKVLFCLPLRGGVITLFFINLLVVTGAVFIFGYLDFVKVILQMFRGGIYDIMHHGTRSKVHLNLVVPLVLVFGLAELVMTVFALVAVLREKLKLIEAYLYYSTMVTVFVVCFRILDVFYVGVLIDLSTTAVFLLFKAYYLICIRSLVKKQQGSTPATMEMSDNLDS